MPKLIEVKRSPSGLTIKAAKDKSNAEIVIYGPIGGSWDGSGISAKQFSDELKNLGDVKEITVRINSPGGDVFEGVTIYNRLKQHKAKITVYVDAMAASIASIIMLAGDKVILGEGSQILIHKPWTFAYGNSNDFEATIDRLEDIEEQLISIYAKKTKLPRAELKSLLRGTSDGTWFDADEAIAKGFADEKADADEFRVAASIDVPWIKNKPASLVPTGLVKNKVSELREHIEGFLAR